MTDKTAKTVKATEDALELMFAVHRSKETVAVVARRFKVPKAFVELVRRQTDDDGVLEINDALLDALLKITDPTY